MLTQGEDVEVHALRKRGWSYVAIGRHIDRDWRTVKAYLEGREPGVRRRTEPDPLERFMPYLRARFADDPHVWASALFDEVVALDYPLSYPSFFRQLRTAGLRPHCDACEGVNGRDTIGTFFPSSVTSAAPKPPTSAREHGHDPQPGLALLRLAQGRVDVADAAIRSVEPTQ